LLGALFIFVLMFCGFLFFVVLQDCELGRKLKNFLFQISYLDFVFKNDLSYCTIYSFLYKRIE